VVTELQDETNAWRGCVARRRVDENGCWISPQRPNAKGYAAVHLGSRPSRRSVLVHRLAIAVTLGFAYDSLSDLCDDEGRRLTVDHLCRVRSCFNPDHLELVEHRTNVLRGQTLAAAQVAQSHCLRGHRLVGANLIPSRSSGGRRSCMICARVHGRINSRRRSGSPLTTVWSEVELEVVTSAPDIASYALGDAA
jgi:hypothetical protein